MNHVSIKGPDFEARCKVLESELDEANERIAQLEVELGLELQAPAFLGLTRQESVCFGVLFKRKLAFKSTFMAALYGNDPDEGAEPKIVDVFICKLRAKLKTFDVHVETQWGEGFFMPPSSKQRVEELMLAEAT